VKDRVVEEIVGVAVELELRRAAQEQPPVPRRHREIRRMNDDRDVEALRSRPERIESRRVETFLFDTRADLNGTVFQVTHGPLQFFGRGFR
jgi:hypothetical protein